jgi:hypothetical protein
MFWVNQLLLHTTSIDSPLLISQRLGICFPNGVDKYIIFPLELSQFTKEPLSFKQNNKFNIRMIKKVALQHKLKLVLNFTSNGFLSNLKNSKT